MVPQLSSDAGYGVALVGEALGETEVEYGAPFVGKAGFKLTRLLEWAGLDREKFDIWNTVWCRPPNNDLEGTVYERGAIEHCRATKWGGLLKRVRVVVPMGNVPLYTFTNRKGILSERGYVSTPAGAHYHLLPTVHPSFIQRGQSKYSAAFIHDVQKAVALAGTGLPHTNLQYVLDPTPGVALQWAKDTLLSVGSGPIAFDIETPGKGDDEADPDSDTVLGDGYDKSYFIWRVGFSATPHTALSIPFTPEYVPTIRLLLGSSNPKVVWNANFDVPRLRYNGIDISGVIHDGMVAWHILHSDLPKGLGFVATFTCPYQPRWKHLSSQLPAFYNATDADVELRSYLVIEEELRRSGLWDVYQRDVLDLDPILVYMTQAGMPIDADVRLDRAIKLADRIKSVSEKMDSVIPDGVRKVKIYATRPKSQDGLITVRVREAVPVCDRCGHTRPTKPHFRAYKRPTEKRPQNPCAGAGVRHVDMEVEKFARVDAFKPSRHQLMKYQEVMGRLVPTTYDSKTKTRRPSMDEKALKTLLKKYPLDPLYPLVLEYRELDKVAGTYIGRPQ